MKWWIIALLIGGQAAYKHPYDSKELCEQSIPQHVEVLNRLSESNSAFEPKELKCVESENVPDLE